MGYSKKLGLRAFFILLIMSQLVYAQDNFPANGPLDKRPMLFAIVHANIQVNPTVMLTDADILIRDGKIAAVGKNLALPPNTKIIKGNGKYIYPSFIDMYSNYGVNAPAVKQENTHQYTNNREGAYTWNDAVKPDFSAAAFFRYSEKQSKDLLAAGVGVCLSQSTDGIFRGSGALVLTGEGYAQQLILKQEAAAAMSFSKGSSRQEYPSSAMGSVALIRQTYLDALWYKTQKEEVNLSFENFNRLAALPVVFEAENKYAVLRAARIGKEFGKNYFIKGRGDEYQRMQEIKDMSCALIIPLNFPKPYEVEDPFDAMNVSLADLKHWQMAPHNAAFLNKAGIPFALTSFGCDSKEFLKNLRKAVQCGLPAEAALKALTTLPAEWLKTLEKTGTIESGKLANFFVCNGPLFSDETILETHYIAGREHAVQDAQQYRFGGYYKVNIGNEVYALNLMQKGHSYEGKLLGADTFQVSLQGKNEVYTLSWGGNGKTAEKNRATLWVSAFDTLSYQVKAFGGKAMLVKAEWADMKAVLDSVRTEKERKESRKAMAPGQIIYPFTEYGNASLPKAEMVLFKNATVWTNESDGIATQTDVLIKDGKIVAVGKNLSPAGARVVDATGKHLTSGIIDEHSHIAIYRGVNECTQNITAEVRIGDVVNPDDINIYRQLSGGVVACQQLHGSCNPVGGQSSIIKLRWGAGSEEMKIKGADGFIKFALGENVKRSNGPFETDRYPRSRMGVEQVYYDAFIRAREYEARMKQNPALTRRDLEMETLLEILNGKRFISCHSYVQSEINMLMHVADSMHFKVNTFTHILEGYKVADKMKQHGVSASTFADWWAYKYEVVEAIPQNAAILTKMGVVTAINSDDAEMGRRLNQEAAKMVRYGNLTEEEAWKLVTLNPATMLHLNKQTGSIKAGKDADLVLWSANPLSIDAQAEMTWVDGICYFNRSAEAAKMKEIEKERQEIILQMIAAKQNGEKTEKKVSEPDPDYHCEDAW